MIKSISLMLLSLLLLSCNKNSEKKQLPAPCLLEPNPGPCDAYIPRYYYDQDTGECKEFVWGGCDGVVPFITLEECQEACE